MPQLRTQQLSVQHVGPVDLTIVPGEIVCLSGASGSGKSLILRALADLIPHEGQVFLDEIDAQHMSPAPWYEAQYAIPLLGMILGNTMVVGNNARLSNTFKSG